MLYILSTMGTRVHLVKSRFNSGNSYCPSVQNVLSSRLLSKNAKVKIYKLILPVLFCVSASHAKGRKRLRLRLRTTEM
jgi:hypothetical protein